MINLYKLGDIVRRTCALLLYGLSSASRKTAAILPDKKKTSGRRVAEGCVYCARIHIKHLLSKDPRCTINKRIILYILYKYLILRRSIGAGWPLIYDGARRLICGRFSLLAPRPRPVAGSSARRALFISSGSNPLLLPAVIAQQYADRPP